MTIYYFSHLGYDLYFSIDGKSCLSLNDENLTPFFDWLVDSFIGCWVDCGKYIFFDKRQDLKEALNFLEKQPFFKLGISERAFIVDNDLFY